MTFDIRPIDANDIAGFHAVLDEVARERRYIAFLQAPPLEETRAFILDGIAKGHSRFVAVQEGSVVGWCDVCPNSRPVQSHVGSLGMGLSASARGLGIGTRLEHVAVD